MFHSRSYWTSGRELRSDGPIESGMAMPDSPVLHVGEPTLA
jgi:hypothetical protein